MSVVLGLYCAESGFRTVVAAQGKKPLESMSKEKTSDNLAESVMGLLQKAGHRACDISTIVVCIGPGSFTGNRVAVSFAKGLASGLGKVKIVPFSTFDFLAFKKQCDVVLTNAFSSYVYVRQNGKEACVDFESLNLDGMKVVANIGIQQKLNNCTFEEPNTNFVDFVLSVCENDGIEAKDLHPVYLRASQAEIEREKRLKQ